MIAALVPAKALDQAKGRLAALFSEDERRRLALTMLEDVLRSLHAVSSIDRVAVVSPDADVLTRTCELGAQAIAEATVTRGINQALLHAVREMTLGPADTLLIILADVPAATPGDIQASLAALEEGHGVVICPSSDNGTSLLALRPPDAIPFRFGQRSFTAHKREAAVRGVRMEVLRVERLSRDLDTPEDVRYLLEHPAETVTHRLLSELGTSQRLAR